MALVIIKIGENEPPTYERYNLLSHHGDIIEILDDGMDPGRMTLKEYLCIKVDTEKMKPEEYLAWKQNLLESVMDKDGNTIMKRKYKITDAPKILTAEEINTVNTNADVKCAIKPTVYKYIDDQSKIGVTPSKEDVASYEKTLPHPDIKTTNDSISVVSVISFNAELIDKQAEERKLSSG